MGTVGFSLPPCPIWYILRDCRTNYLFLFKMVNIMNMILMNSVKWCIYTYNISNIRTTGQLYLSIYRPPQAMNHEFFLFLWNIFVTYALYSSENYCLSTLFVHSWMASFGFSWLVFFLFLSFSLFINGNNHFAWIVK